MLELHCAHGYLLSSFITPLLNRRTDEYGGTFENRLRYPFEVFHAIRAVWPSDRPISVRISATDWVGGRNLRRRRRRDRARLQGCRRRPHRRFDRANVAQREARLRADVSDAVRRQDSQRNRHRDDGGRQRYRCRSSQRDTRGGAGRSRRARAAASGGSILDAARRRAARLCARRLAGAVPARQGTAGTSDRARAGTSRNALECSSGRKARGGYRRRARHRTRRSLCCCRECRATRQHREPVGVRSLRRKRAILSGALRTSRWKREVKRAFAACREAHGPIAILVNNSGIAESAPLARTRHAMWERILATNLTGTFLCTREAAEDMIAAQVGSDRQRRQHRRARRCARTFRPTARANTASSDLTRADRLRVRGDGRHRERTLPGLHGDRHDA